MSDFSQYAINRRAGRTIRLDFNRAPPPAGTAFYDWFIAPDADESLPNRIKTTDRDDLILINGDNWYDTLSIDGGDGVNVVQGTFGGPQRIGNFMPDVKNVQWALLRSETSRIALDFAHWTGLTYVEARGLQGPLSPNMQTAFDDNVQTRFINIPLDLRQIGVANFNGIAVFEFAPPPPQSVSFHPLHLYLDRNAIGGEIHINIAPALHIHATGANGHQILRADGTAMMTVDGNGDVNLQHSSSLPITIDASAATGSCILTAFSNRAVTIKVGRGSHNEITTNGRADRIDLLPNHLGRNTYIPLDFSIPPGASTPLPNQLGGISVTDDNLNAQAIQIKNFIPGLDRIDFRKIPVAGYTIAVTHEDLSGRPTLKAAAEYAASRNARKGQHTITFFEYRCRNEQVKSTYAFNDQSGDQKISYGDGLIKLVGVSSQAPTGFVTPADFN